MDDPASIDVLRVRLYITVGCGILSIISGVVMFVAYRRYRIQLANPQNDLYVLGLGLFGFLQSIQLVVFGVVHLIQVQGQGDSFSPVACIVNASLQQFFNMGSQVFAFAFFVSLMTLRGTACDRWWSSSIAVIETAVSRSNRKSFMETPAGTPRGRLTQNLSETIESEPTWCASHDTVTRLVWPIIAILAGVVTTAVMCAIVIHDPSEAPSPLTTNPESFEVNLGWCWIPSNHPQLRAYLNYIPSFITVIMSIASFVALSRFEVGITWSLHKNIYRRLLALALYILVAYSLGSCALFLNDSSKRVMVSYAATAMFMINGVVQSVVFLWTEKVSLRTLFFEAPSEAANVELPGNGFSKAVNHLLVMTVEGVYLPSSSINRFSTRDRYAPGESDRLVASDEAMIEEVLSTRRLLRCSIEGPLYESTAK